MHSEKYNFKTSVVNLDAEHGFEADCPVPVAIEVKNSTDNNEEVLLKVKAEIMYAKLLGHHTVGIMDSHSAAWGEVGWQMFGKEDEITGVPRYTPSNVLLFDFEEAFPTTESRKLFDPEFPMTEMIQSILRECDKLFKKHKVDHFVFFGNERVCSGDGKWLHKFMESGFVVFRTAGAMTAREDCFMAVMAKS